MKIKITGRQISISESLKEYADKKLSRLEKYFNQIIEVHLVMSVTKIDHFAELVINGDGVQFHGKEKAADLYSAIDLLAEKVEKQVVRYKEKLSSHKSVTLNEYVSMDVADEKGEEIMLYQVSNKPTDKIEAYLQMRVDKRDFILFKKGVSRIDSDLDYENKNYGVIYREGAAYRLLKIPFENIKEKAIGPDVFEEYELKVIDESAGNPKIEFNKLPKANVKMLSLNQAMQAARDSNSEYLPFFNIESEYFNVIYKNGKEYEVMVPAF
jgi:putative sigma-54 modulation protein